MPHSRPSQALDVDLDWVTAHTRYHVRAVEWDARQRSSALVLRGAELEDAERWLARGGAQKPPPSLLQRQLIAAGRQAAVRTQRLAGGALSTGLLVAIVLAVIALVQRNQARAARDDALRNLYTLRVTRAADPASPSRRGRPFAQENIVTALVLSPDERTFVTTGASAPRSATPPPSASGDTSELRVVASLVGHGARVQAAAFSPDRRDARDRRHQRLRSPAGPLGLQTAIRRSRVSVALKPHARVT